MTKVSFHKFTLNSLYVQFISMSAIWTFGIFAGSIFAAYFEPDPSPLMLSAVVQPMSIVGLLVSIFLPFLCTYLSVACDCMIVVHSVCFIKALAVGFSGMMCFTVFGSATWFISFLLMFSSICSAFISFFIGIFHCHSQSCIHKYKFFLCFFFLFFISIFDLCVLSPFLQGLF